MKKTIYLLGISIFLLSAKLAMAGPPFGMPSITDTEEGKWVKNKIHDGIEKYGERYDSKTLKGAAKVMRGAGWDKEENQRAEEEYNKKLFK